MKRHDVRSLSDEDLERDIVELAARERRRKAELLAFIAEFEARRLFRDEGFPSMEAFCVGRYRVDEDEVFALVLAARTARRFPQIFEAIADGRLHVEGVALLAPHLSPETADDLLRAAEKKGESEIRRLLAGRVRPEGSAETA